MATVTATAGGFSIGRVINRTFTSVAANLLNLLIVTVLLVSVPAAAIGWVQENYLTNVNGLGAGVGASLINGLLSLVLGLVHLALTAAAQGAIFYFVFRDLAGRKSELGDGLSTGLAHCWPLWLVSFCVGLMTILGFIGLIVPGVLLALRWCVALPTQVIENKGVFASMARSAELTRGRRWSIFGLFLIVAVVVWIVEFALIMVFAGSGGGLLAELNAPITRILITPVIGLITTPLFGAGYAALYYELRSTREGVGVEEVAAVFD